MRRWSPADRDVAALERLVRQVREDAERMKAFVRFRSIGPRGSEYFVAWHRPDHDVAALVAPYFARRYPNMRWSIFTPATSVHWDAGRLECGRGVPADALPSDDSNAAPERLWRTYYAAAFNPARVNAVKLARDLPSRFREPLPEGTMIPALLLDAPARAQRLRQETGGVTARALVPDAGDLETLRGAAALCRACPLHAAATQTVFGEGPPDARLVLVGEQPGDVEDRSGRPFTGPAGEVLDRALAAAGILRRDAYVTNAVKHFAWEPRGKRRIHRTPRLSEMRACRPWLEAELGRLRPRVVVCLGRTAAQTLLGPQAQVAALRGRVITGQAWAPNDDRDAPPLGDPEDRRRRLACGGVRRARARSGGRLRHSAPGGGIVREKEERGSAWNDARSPALSWHPRWLRWTARLPP